MKDPWLPVIGAFVGGLAALFILVCWNHVPVADDDDIHGDV